MSKEIEKEEKSLIQEFEQGKYLQSLILNYKNTGSEHIFAQILYILRNISVCVPMRVVESKKLENNKEEVEITLQPDILEGDGLICFPIFTHAREMGKYGKEFSKVQVPLVNVLYMAEAYDDVVGLVIDAFSLKMIIDKRNFADIREMPTIKEMLEIQEKEKKEEEDNFD